MLWKPGPGRHGTCPSPPRVGSCTWTPRQTASQGVGGALHVPVDVGYREEGHENDHNSDQESLGRDWRSCLCSQPCCFTGCWQVRTPEHVRHVCRSDIRPALRDRELLKLVNGPLCSRSHSHRRVHTSSRAGGKGPLESIWPMPPAQSMLRDTSDRVVNTSMDRDATVSLGSLLHQPQSK